MMVLQQPSTCKKTLAILVMLALLPRCSTFPLRQAPFEHITHPVHNALSTAFAATKAASESVTIMDVLGQRPEFSKLLETIRKDKELTDILADPGTKPTLFAPTNEAFDSLTDIRIPTRELLMYHISPLAYNTTFLRVEPLIQSMYETQGLNGGAQYLRIAPEHPSIPSATFPRPSLWRFKPEWIDQDDEEELLRSGSHGQFSIQADELFVNRAKIVLPDLTATSGGIVHGVNRIIQPPGDTILDEILRYGKQFSILAEAWAHTQVDVHIRERKGLTLFAAPDKAWKALPKKLKKFLFSDKGREHLKIFTMYMIGDRAIYTPEIFNRTNDDGSKSPNYKDIEIQSLLNSPDYKLHVQGQLLRFITSGKFPHELLLPEDVIDYVDENTALAKELASATLHELKMAVAAFGGDDDDDDKDKDKNDKHHVSHKNPNHPHHHNHKKHKYHKSHHYNDDHHGGKVPRGFERNEIFVNKKARIEHGLENWIAGNGVIHVIDHILMPPKSKGCDKSMVIEECQAWEQIWQLADDFEDEEEEEGQGYFGEMDDNKAALVYP